MVDEYNTHKTIDIAHLLSRERRVYPLETQDHGTTSNSRTGLNS